MKFLSRSIVPADTDQLTEFEPAPLRVKVIVAPGSVVPAGPLTIKVGHEQTWTRIRTLFDGNSLGLGLAAYAAAVVNAGRDGVCAFANTREVPLNRLLPLPAIRPPETV